MPMANSTRPNAAAYDLARENDPSTAHRQAAVATGPTATASAPFRVVATASTAAGHTADARRTDTQEQPQSKTTTTISSNQSSMPSSSAPPQRTSVRYGMQREMDNASVDLVAPQAMEMAQAFYGTNVPDIDDNSINNEGVSLWRQEWREVQRRMGSPHQPLNYPSVLGEAVWNAHMTETDG